MSTATARRGRMLAAIALAGALPSCAPEYGNPFAGSDRTAAPSAAADIVFTSNLYAARPGPGREVYAMEDTGANPTRLSFCTEEGVACSSFEVAFSADRRRSI